jgi:hypothetical protein
MVVPRAHAPAGETQRLADLRADFDRPNIAPESQVAFAVGRLFCPFPASKVNPHAFHVHRASLEWARRLGLVRSQKQYRELDRARIAWVEARAFPSASRDVLQLATDWTTLFCLFDDSLETRHPAPIDLSADALQLLAALEGKATRELTPLGAGLVDVRRRMLGIANKRITARFVAIFRELLGGFLWEEINRWKDLRPTRHAYRTMRQITVGLRPQFVFGEIANSIELSEHARHHADILELQSITCSLVGCVNDIFTCIKEVERDSAHNAALLLMQEESLSLSDVLLRLTGDHDELMRRFEAIATTLPDFGSDNEAVECFVCMLKACIRGHLDWARETGRYAR